MRVRFAPSPTGNVHLGNIRVAIFNWLLARHSGGKFILRIEDTDLERSTPEAIKNMRRALEWLGLDYDEPPLYQTARRTAHDAAIAQMLQSGTVWRKDAKSPVILQIAAPLFDASFISAPRDEVVIKFDAGELTVTARSLIHSLQSPKSGETFITPINWDTLTNPVFVLDDGTEISALELRPQSTATSPLPKKISALKFIRRYVFFDDLVLGRCEKPLDSIRDFTIARGDGSPVFHLANVVDDIHQEITHILRGNDHVENSFRHLFIFRALAANPPRYGHFPMIVNHSGKPYSKRDGDAYVGDFQTKGFLPAALFNYLALCGWSPGDDREVMTREELVAAFSLERVSKAAAQFDLKKLTWMNQQYIKQLPENEFVELLKTSAVENNFNTAEKNAEWWKIMAATQRDRLEKISDFAVKCRYFFTDDYQFDPKAVKKHLCAGDNAGLRVLEKIRLPLAEVTAADWSSKNLLAVLHQFAEQNPIADAPMPLGNIAQPLRVAISGSAATPEIGETLFLLGREKTLARVDRARQEIDLDIGR